MGPSNQQTKHGNLCNKVSISHLSRDLVNRDHMGCSKLTAGGEKESKSCAHVEAFNEKRANKNYSLGSTDKLIGPDPATHFIYNNLNEFGPTSSTKDDFYEVFLGTSQQQAAPNDIQIAEDETRENVVEIEGDTLQLYRELQNPEREGSKFEKRTTDLVQNPKEAIENWEVEEVEPLHSKTQLMIQDKEKEISLWVQQNMVKLGKMIGVDFLGHEEEALELLLQVDSSRRVSRMETDATFRKTRIKGAQELKSLVAFDVKFKSSESRAKGRTNHNSS